MMEFWRFDHSMIDSSQQLVGQYDYSLIALSIFVMFIASLTVQYICSTIQASDTHIQRDIWIVSAALVMGGGIWSMHFIGMLAFTLPVPIAYDIKNTLLSIPPAILASSFFLLHLTKKEFTWLHFLISTICLTVGVGSMHFLGMEAMEANVFMRYQVERFAVVIVSSFLMCFAALYVSFYPGKNQKFTRLPLLGSVLMTVFVSFAHYTGMWSTQFFSTAINNPAIDEALFTSSQLAIAIGVTTCFLILLLIIATKTVAVIRQDIAELKKIQAQVIQSSKLASLGEMSTCIAHELNQPLHSIRMANSNMLDRLEAESIDIPYMMKKIQRIDHQVERASAIINHMKLFGREANETPVNLDPESVIEQTLLLIGEQLRLEDIKVLVHSEEKCPPVIGHEILFEQVFVNLILNARDAIVSHSEGNQRNITITSRVLNEARVEISICDTGGGIAEDILHRIFEPFFTTKLLEKGTGLGLSVSYGIICDMGGTLSVENIEDGARFAIRLPMATVEPSTDAQASVMHLSKA